MKNTAIPSILLACVFTAPGFAKEDASIVSSLPIRFEKAEGERVFTARGLGYNLVLTPSRSVLSLTRASGASRRLEFGLVGANPHAVADASDVLPLRTSYYRGTRSIRSVAAYRKAGYTGILPGVDVVYYGSGGQLEFDLIVHPGADPSAIAMRYSGQDRMQLDAEGNLLLEAGDQRLVQKAPAVYQRTGTSSIRLVSAEYRLRRDGTLGYHVGAYDKKLPLIIDPVISYSTFLGGGAPDTAVSILRDRVGYLYVAGSTRSQDMAQADSGAQPIHGGDLDAYVMKIDPNVPPDRSVVYATYFGGSGKDEVTAMAFDSQGRLNIVGVTNSTDFPATPYSHQESLGGETDGFLLTLDTTQSGDASLVYATYLGGTLADGIMGLGAGAGGRIVVAGYTSSTDFPMRGASLQSASGGGRDGFVADFDVFGTLSYSTYLGGDRTDSARAVAIGADGGIWVAGATTSWGFPATSPDVNFYQPGGDAFVAKIDASAGVGGLRLSRFIGGSSLDEATGLLLTADGRVIVTGFTISEDFPVTSGARFHGGTDIFVTVLDPTRESPIYYSTLIGGGNGDIPYGVALDASGRLLMTGYTTSLDWQLTEGAIQTTYAGPPAEAFVLRMDLTRGAETLLYSTYLGGTYEDIGYGVCGGPAGRIYVVGETTSSRFPSVSETSRDSLFGASDGFVLAIDTETVQPQQ